MSDHVSKSSHDEEATSRTSSQARQPSWMSHWTRGNSKSVLKVNKPSLICDRDELADGKSGTALSRFKKEDGVSKPGKGMNKDPEMLATVFDEKKKPGVFKNDISVPLFPTGSHCHNIGTTSTVSTQVNPEFGSKSLSLALAFGREDTSTDLNLLGENNWRRNGKQPVCHSYKGQKALVCPTPCTGKKAGSAFYHGSGQADAGKPVVVFERHFSNDNFTIFGQDNCKYQKYSSFFIHETGMKNNNAHHEERQNNGLHQQHGQSANKNFRGLFNKQQKHSTAGLFPNQNSMPNMHQEISHHHSPATVPFFRNVETMRICTMVDAVENSPGGHHKVSQRANHFLFTKETCVNLSNGHQELRKPAPFTHCGETTFEPFHSSPDVTPYPSGVKIQPLWTSTDDDEKENTGNSSTFKAGSRDEASAESSGIQVELPKKRHTISDMPSSPLHEDDTVDRNSTPVACDSSTEKTRNIEPLLEIPDINEEVPELQPVASSTAGEETSTSRVHSLDAKQIFSYGKQTSGNECNGGQDRPLGPDTNNRWIKRLKLNSSDSSGVGTKSSDAEGSSREKFHSFFTRYVKGNRESLVTKLNKLHNEGPASADQNVESMVSRKINQSEARGCSWIQRWCQSKTVPLNRNPEPLVICEPHSLKFGQDETAKKHFPSIGALALMGKAMNGFRSCEFNKRGSVVVWDTKEY